MRQNEKVGSPSETMPPLRSAGPAGVETMVPGAEPEVLRPRCPHCQHDPIELWRLRYDFPDGVVAETLFCGHCRAMVNATIVGVDRSIIDRAKKQAAALPVPVEPPAATMG